MWSAKACRGAFRDSPTPKMWGVLGHAQRPNQGDALFSTPSLRRRSCITSYLANLGLSKAGLPVPAVFMRPYQQASQLTFSRRQTLRVMAGDSYAECRRSSLVGVTFRASDPVAFNHFSR